MQDYKAGIMVGSTPRYLTIMQLIATPVGAAAVSWMYPLLRDTYGIVGEHAGLSSPISRKWAGFAEILSQGLSALPPGSARRTRDRRVLGIVLTVSKAGVSGGCRPRPVSASACWCPPPSSSAMFLGGVGERIWHRVDRKSNELYMTPLASGLIAGEAIIAVVIPLLVVLGLVHP
jgi:uncharacterized oligopeptide transporter (OPT) family protein